MVPSDALSSAANIFKTSFQGIQSDFFSYGQAIFFTLLTISIVFKALEYGWTKDITEGLPDWIRELIGAMFFWTVMQNLSLLASLPNSANFMGGKYLPALDPSSIILKGVIMTNTIMQPLAKAGLMDAGIAAMFIGIICCVVIIFCMVNIALEVAVTLICTQGIISISPLFLAAGAFKPSSQIARNAIDAVIGNSVKLLGFYLVIFAGNKAVDSMSAQIDGTFNQSSTSFDQYSYIIAVVALYYSVAKTFPEQVARLVTGVIQENRGINAMAAAAAALSVAAKSYQAATKATEALKTASNIAKPGVQAGGATMANALANYREIASSNPANSIAKNAGAAAKQALGTVGKATAGNIADRFRDLGSKLTGGSSSGVSSISDRVNKSTNAVKAQTQANQTIRQTQPNQSPQTKL